MHNTLCSIKHRMITKLEGFERAAVAKFETLG